MGSLNHAFIYSVDSHQVPIIQLEKGEIRRRETSIQAGGG